MTDPLDSLTLLAFRFAGSVHLSPMVLVHRSAGIGRTGTFLASMVIRELGLELPHHVPPGFHGTSVPSDAE